MRSTDRGDRWGINMLEEKYRPQRLDDIAGQDDVINKIRRYIDLQPAEIPHFFFAGPPGTGKTATAGAIKNELNADIIELNASDDRGIEVIRKRVIPAMRFKFGGHKIIFMDEADMLTEESQRALRRPLERYNKATVIMTANVPERVNDAVQDRMNCYAFKPISPEDMLPRLQYIAEREGIDGVDYHVITERAGGSMRKAIKLLEDRVGIEELDSGLMNMAKEMGL